MQIVTAGNFLGQKLLSPSRAILLGYTKINKHAHGILSAVVVAIGNSGLDCRIFYHSGEMPCMGL